MFPTSFSHLIDLPARPRADDGPRLADDAAVLIRPASPDDEPAIERLAALDEHDLPRGQRLIAEREGRPVAALEVASGAAVSDPFVPTSGIVELLGLRAAQVRR